MALDELFKTFEFLKKRIEDHRDYLSQDETRTRQVLIDPLLKELGWDVGDPNAVELEHQIEKPFGGKGVYKPDYALMHEGKAVAVVEAKRLGVQSLDDATLQVHNYAINEVIPYGVATDGNEWRLIDVHKLVKPEEKVTTLFNVSADDASRCALGSLALWRPNLSANDGPVGAIEPVLIQSASAAQQSVERGTDGGEIHVSATSDSDAGYQGEWHPIVGKLPKGLPISVQFGGNAQSKWVSWKQYYIDVAKYVLSSGGIRTSDAPVRLTRGKNCAINVEPEHPDGRRFKEPVRIAAHLWLETRLNSDGFLELSRRLLKAYHSDPESVQVRFD